MGCPAAEISFEGEDVKQMVNGYAASSTFKLVGTKR